MSPRACLAQPSARTLAAALLASDSGRGLTARRVCGRHVGTRTVTQVRTHAQKYVLKLAKQQPPGDGAAAADGASTAEFAECGDCWDASEDEGADAA